MGAKTKKILKGLGLLTLSGLVAFGLYNFMGTGEKLSVNLHDAAEVQKMVDESPFDFFKTNQGRLNDLVQDLQVRTDLTAALPFKKLRGAASSGVTLSSYNEYFGVKNVSVDNIRDSIDFSYTVAAKKFLQAEEALWCPPADRGAMLSGSGSNLLNTSGNKLLSFAYFIDLEKSGETQGGVRELGFNSSRDVNESYVFEEKFSLEKIPVGKHTLTIIPSCENRYPNKTSVLEPFIIAAPFEKRALDLSGVPKATAGDSMLRVVSPELDNGTSGEMLTTIPYVGTDGKRTSVKVPYIQTNQNLTVRVAVDINAYLRDKYRDTDHFKSLAKNYAENDVLSVSLLLFGEDKKLVRQVESPFFSDSILNENITNSFIKEVELVFPNLPKDTYQLVIRLNRSESKNGFVSSVLVKQSRVPNIAIGDIIMAFGDERTEGKGSTEVLAPFSKSREAVGHGEASSDATGRHIAWAPKNCEASKDLCNQPFVSYTSFTKQLGERLSNSLGYPVMVLNEGLGGKPWTLAELAEYFKTPSPVLKERLGVLKPSAAIITFTGKNQMTLIHAQDEHPEQPLDTALNQLTERLKILLGHTNNPVFLSTPEFTGDPLEYMLIGAIRTFVVSEEHDVYPGADLYSASIEKGDLGLSYPDVATTWAKSLVPYLMQRSGITPPASE